MCRATSLWFFLVAFLAAGSLACAQDVGREVRTSLPDSNATADEDSYFDDDLYAEAAEDVTDEVADEATDVIQARRGPGKGGQGKRGQGQRRGAHQKGPGGKHHGKRHLSPECKKLMKALQQEMRAKRNAIMQACGGLPGHGPRGAQVLSHVSPECMAQIKALRQETKAKRRAIAQQCGGGHGPSPTPPGGSTPPDGGGSPQPSPAPSPAPSPSGGGSDTPSPSGSGGQ
jgi:hypothetical protein